AECEIGAAGVPTPVMEVMAITKCIAEPKMLGSQIAGRRVEPLLTVQLPHSQHDVSGSLALLPGRRIPPTPNEIRARRPFANHQRLATSVRDVGQAYSRPAIQH